MTKEQAIKLLTNKKVFVKNKSSEIQEKLFSLGIYWGGNSATVQFEDAPFLYIGMNKGIIEITYGSNVDYFYGHRYDEITVDDILNITIDEPKYRPFKDAEECWQEMLKHQPFGWIKNKYGGDWQIMATVSNFKDFKKIFAMSTFADGTPFGIKEY